MQLSIHYQEEDEYLINRLERLADRKRMSKSALILSILEEYLEAEQRVGKILRDMGAIERKQLQEAINLQQKQAEEERIGEIMLEKGYIEEVQLDRALGIQSANENGTDRAISVNLESSTD